MFEVNDIVLYNRTDVCRVPWMESPLIRKKEYTELLGRGKPDELIALVRTLNAQRVAKLSAGHKLSEADEKYLSAAQKKLFPMFRYVLNVEWEEFLTVLSAA